jgi:lipopolysaccharide export system permease protein
MSIVGGAISVIIILFDLAELVRKSSSKVDVDFSTIIQMLFLKVPLLLQQVFPFMILFASILTFWSLTRYQEIVIMKSSGLSIWQIIFPLVGIAWFLGGIDLTVFNPIVSRMMFRYEQMDNRFFQRNIEDLVIAESGLWIRERKGNLHQIFQIKHVDLKQQTFQKISLLQFDPNDHFLKRFESQTGHIKDNFIILKEVWQQAYDSIPEYKEVVKLPTTLSMKSLQNTGTNPYGVSFWKLPHMVDILESSGLSGHKYLLYWHSLIARWVWLGVMVVLAASCSLKIIRQQKTIIHIGGGVFGAFLLYILRDITYALGSAGTIPVVLSAWAPVIISGLLGLTALLYFEEG